MTDIVRLTGTTSRSKNFIKARGDIWKISGFRSTSNNKKHNNCSGPFMLLENGKSSRLVSIQDDPEYQVEFIK